jgi:hypothetical protein
MPALRQIAPRKLLALDSREISKSYLILLPGL